MKGVYNTTDYTIYLCRMTDIIKTIDKLRKAKRVSKTALCKASGISSNMYARYLVGSSISHTTAVRMLDYLGYRFIITIKE